MLLPFALEDFFDEFEHQPDLINLASSDAQPWTGAELEAKGIPFPTAVALKYPDPKLLLPRLARHCQLSDGASVLPTSGAAEGIALVMHELAATGDDRPVATPRPGYGAFSGLASLLNIPVEFYDYHPARQWTADADELRALARRCRAMVVMAPHNPTGQIIQRPLIEELASELSERRGTLVVDEVFRIDGETEAATTLSAKVVVLGSLSKIYGLPGLRLGWVVADQARLRRLRTVQHYLSLAPTALTVALGASILEDPERFSRASLIRRNRTIVQDWITSLDGRVSMSCPDGGTTACLSIATSVPEMDIFSRFLQQNVLVAPGTKCFEFDIGMPWFRLGYGTTTDALRIGLDRIAHVIGALDER